jgi:hypothetical protein
MFTESNTVEQMILAAVTQLGGTPASMVREDALHYGVESLGDDLRPARWTYVPHTDVPRQLGDVMVEPWVREALIRLNPDIARIGRTKALLAPPLRPRPPQRPVVGHRQWPRPQRVAAARRSGPQHGAARPSATWTGRAG